MQEKLKLKAHKSGKLKAHKRIEAKANPEQKKAIEHDKGPMLIIAGAGTGKTRTITSRIIHLINSGKAKPDEILALTFTEKAADEMVERVDKKMPLGYEDLCIKTFHAFSERILREAGLEIGIDSSFKILSQVEQWLFFKKNLFSFDLDYYRPLGNPNKFIYGLLNHFNKLKDELISPDAYLKHAEKLEGEEGEKMKEIAQTYKTYQNLLIENNYFDFGDLTYYAVELFKKRFSVLKEYQNRYKYILVDEFQDTNYAQFELVMLLAKEHRNIVVVGDDDQSIYKWRGASLSNIVKFEENFPEHKKVLLTKNFRSPKSILDGAYQLIQNNNPDRLEVKAGVNKRLECQKDFDEPIEIHHFHDFLQETSFVAEKIKFLHQNEGVPFEEITVLVRSNNLTHPFIDELNYLGIPYQVKNPKGLMILEEIKDFAALIQFLANPNNDIACLRILKMDIFDIPMAKILDILDKAGKDHIFKVMQAEYKSGFKKPYDLLMHLIEFSKKNSTGIVINEFLNRSGYLNYLIKNEKYEELDNINELAKQVSRFERKNEHKSVIDFAAYLNLLEEADSPLTYEEFADRESVQVLTAHGAKGLQFEYVFIVNTVNHRFPAQKRRDTFEIPEELTNEIFPEGDYHLQEERRLMYVAMTRAKKKVFTTYSDRYEGNKKWQVSPFVNEINESGAAVWTDHKETEDAIKKLKKFKEPNKSIFKLPAFTKEKLSYSQIDTFKTCPLKYNYRYLMKAPVLQSHAANFGTSIHNTLKEFYRLFKKGLTLDFEMMRKLYEKNWVSSGYESKEHEETRKKKGLEILKIFYEANYDPRIIPAFLERQFNVKIGDFWINGRIDRIDKLEDGSFEVIDYKTGHKAGNMNIDKDLQLSIYALACRDILKIPVSKLSLYYLEDNEKVSTQRSDKQIDVLYDEIKQIVENMKKSDFSPTPGFLCKFCDFRLICPAV